MQVSPPDSPFELILTSREKRELHHELFRDRVLVGIDLSGADLHGARFEQTILESCNLAGADPARRAVRSSATFAASTSRAHSWVGTTSGGRC